MNENRKKVCAWAALATTAQSVRDEQKAAARAAGAYIMNKLPKVALAKTAQSVRGEQKSTAHAALAARAAAGTVDWDNYFNSLVQSGLLTKHLFAKEQKEKIRQTVCKPSRRDQDMKFSDKSLNVESVWGKREAAFAKKQKEKLRQDELKIEVNKPLKVDQLTYDNLTKTSLVGYRNL